MVSFPLDIEGREAQVSIPPCTDGTVCPPGALALDYTKCLYYIEPRSSMIDVNGGAAFAAGLYFAQPLTAAHFSDVPSLRGNPMLSINRLADGIDVDLMGQKRNQTASTIPYAPSACYMEAAYRYSDNNPDHFGAWWMFPWQHNFAKSDCYAGDPVGFERWGEVDFDESGFCAGPLTSFHDHYGIYPAYKDVLINNAGKMAAIDRTLEQVVGGSLDPVKQVGASWFNGTLAFSASLSGWNANIWTQGWYPIVSAKSHGGNLPWSLIVRYISCWVAP